MKNLYLICLLFIISACGTPTTEDRITFTQVDPFLKVFRESNFFPEYDETEEVAAGEHATFQFAVRAALPLKELSAQVTAFTNEKGTQLQSTPRTGFVDYVRVGRQTPDRAKDAITSLSHYYPDPIIEQNGQSVARDVAQPIWISVPVPTDAEAGNYKATFSLKGTMGNQTFELKKEISVKVYPVVMPQPDLWVTNWFGTSPDKMKIFNGGKEVEPYSDAYWEMVQALADKMKECYSNVILLSPLEHIEFEEKDGTYTFDYSRFDKMIEIFHRAGVLKMLEGGHIAGRSGDWSSQFAPYVPQYENGKKKLVQYPMESEQAVNFYRQFIPSLAAHLKEAYPEVLYAQHIADEPTSDNIKSYVAIARFVKQQCPDIKIIEACHTHDLENILDIWVPQLNFYKECSGKLYQQEEIHHRMNGRFALSYSHCFDKNFIETCCFAQDNCFTGFTGYATQRTGRRAGADKGIWMNGKFFHTGFISQNTSFRALTARVDSQYSQLTSTFQYMQAEYINRRTLPRSGNTTDTHTDRIA